MNGLFGRRAPFAIVLILPCASVNQVVIRLVSENRIFRSRTPCMRVLALVLVLVSGGIRRRTRKRQLKV